MINEDINIFIKDINEVGQVIDKDVCSRLNKVIEMVSNGISGDSEKKIVSICEMIYESLISISNSLKSIN